MKTYWFKKAYLDTGWQSDIKISITDDGLIESVNTDASPQDATVIDGLAIPGFANIHSHAFQRAMAGLSEEISSADDNFWSWRNIMYQFANMITPEEQEHIAAQLYMEMLKAGYTSVAEFHYLHHQPGGQHYDNIAEMSLAVIRAAKYAGIGLTHLPVLYMSSNFGNASLSTQQQRFGNSVQEFQSLLSTIADLDPLERPDRLGIALHSLRAVPPKAISEILSYLNELDNTAPIHIHIAEQTLEVEESIRYSGKRPVEWLYAQHKVNERWCLIHATHLSDDEVTSIAQSGAVVGICPSTEANLGDGFFPLHRYLQQGGNIAIGSDSNTSVSPIEELRWLEYGQRLLHRGRNISAAEHTPHTAERLINLSLAGGSAALGRKVGRLAAGFAADILILDDNTPHLHGKPLNSTLDALVFCGNTAMIRDVMRGGQWVVKNYRHNNEQAIAERYCKTIAQLQKRIR